MTKHPNKSLLTFLWLLALIYGFEFETQALWRNSATWSTNLIVLSALLLLLIYIVPALYLLKREAQKLKQVKVVFIALLSGLFITGWMAVYANNTVGSFWAIVIPDPVIFQEWESALSAPFTEEIIKAGIALALVDFFKIRDKRTIFLMGLAIGLGFQIIEDVAYLLTDGFDFIDDVYQLAWARITGSPGSHYIYSSLFVTGLYGLNKKADITKKQAWHLICIPVALHFFWNTPLNNAPWSSALIMACGLYTFSKAYQTIMKTN